MPRKRLVSSCLPVSGPDCRKVGLFDASQWHDARLVVDGPSGLHGVVTHPPSGVAGLEQLQIEYYAESDASGAIIPINLSSEPAQLGGHRWWLKCPACNAQRRTLYWPGGKYPLGCRICLRLGYESQQAHRNPYYESLKALKGIMDKPADWGLAALPEHLPGETVGIQTELGILWFRTKNPKELLQAMRKEMVAREILSKIV